MKKILTIIAISFLAILIHAQITNNDGSVVTTITNNDGSFSYTTNYPSVVTNTPITVVGTSYLTNSDGSIIVTSTNSDGTLSITTNSIVTVTPEFDAITNSHVDIQPLFLPNVTMKSIIAMLTSAGITSSIPINVHNLESVYLYREHGGFVVNIKLK